MTDVPPEEVLEVEEIPDEADLVRFLADGEFDIYRGQVVTSTNALRDPLLSVDWLGRTTIEDGYLRKPKSKAHAVFVAADARALEQSVRHKPKPDNASHSQVECPEHLQDKGKRRNALTGLLAKKITATGTRPP